MRMIKVLFGMVILLNASCLNSSNEKPIADNKGSLKQDDGSILISSGQFSPYKTIIVNNIEFQFVGNSGDTQYLSTASNLFHTPEGYMVGMKLNEVDESLQKNIVKEPGWGYYIQLKSGWNLAFCEGHSCTDSNLEDSSKVDWIFKRN